GLAAVAVPWLLPASTGAHGIVAVFVGTAVISAALRGLLSAALQGWMRFAALAAANLLGAALLLVGSVLVARAGGHADGQFAVAVLAALIGGALQTLASALGARETGPEAPLTADERRGFGDYWRASAGFLIIELIIWQRTEVLFI